MALTDKQERFCKEYLIDCNGTQAAGRAGYSKKTAEVTAARLLRNVNVSARVAELMAEKDAQLIAQGDEVLKYLTGVMRGEIGEQAVVIDSEGTHTETMPAKISDRNKAAELLGKRWGLYLDRTSMELTAVSADTQAVIDRLLGEKKEPT